MGREENSALRASLRRMEEDTSGNKQQETVTDGAGNVIKVQAQLSSKELKKAQKDIEKKIKDAKKKGTMSEEELWELDDKLTEIKEKLKQRLDQSNTTIIS